MDHLEIDLPYFLQKREYHETRNNTNIHSLHSCPSISQRHLVCGLDSSFEFYFWDFLFKHWVVTKFFFSFFIFMVETGHLGVVNTTSDLVLPDGKS